MLFQLIAVLHPAIALVMAFFDKAKAREGHVKADDGEFLARRHVKDFSAGFGAFFLIDIEFYMPVRPGE